MSAHDRVVDELLTKYSLISDQVTKKEVAIILRLIAEIVDREYDSAAGSKAGSTETAYTNGHTTAPRTASRPAIVEFGCYTGTTSLFIQRLLRIIDPSRPYHVYDSFAGLPDKLPQDESPAGFAFKAGELHAPKAVFIQNFKRAAVPLPIIHKNWFEALDSTDVPSEIAVAFLDGDYFSSIDSCLRLLKNRMIAGGVIIVDDYLSTALPGAKKATDAWLHITGFECSVKEGMAIIRT
jgi:O-methyltransferase